MDDIAQFDFPTDSPKIIKVIGVGVRRTDQEQRKAAKE